jgi:exopolysaccharide biosynthesis WecB/TagA/CpsF family protein
MKFFETRLCGIALPTTNHNQLLNDIKKLSPKAKSSLYFLYSEFLIRANQNSSYRDTLCRSEFMASDGKGIEWAKWELSNRTYKQATNPLILYFSLILNLIKNLFLGFWTIVIVRDTGKKTNNQIILGRDFVYDLVSLAEKNNWKVFLVGGNEQVQSKLRSKYKHLNITSWYKDKQSNLMRDIGAVRGELNRIKDKHIFLNKANLYLEFPDLLEAKNMIIAEKPEFILVCLGGSSGKQELFIDDLKSDEKAQFTLATGLGAALDHLGAGEEQPRVNTIFQERGLEWIYRIFTNPKRAFRTWYSIYMFWWLVSLQPFVPDNQPVTLKNALK